MPTRSIPTIPIVQGGIQHFPSPCQIDTLLDLDAEVLGFDSRGELVAVSARYVFVVLCDGRIEGER